MREKIGCLLVLLTLAGTVPLPACGPYAPDWTFVDGEGPGVPLAGFLEEDLGIVLPTFAKPYLYLTYRRLTGTGPADWERQVFEGLWGGNASKPREYASPRVEWLAERAMIPGIGPSPELRFGRWIVKKRGGYDRHIHLTVCLEDAFRTAARTLRQRTEAYGLDDPRLIAWVNAQDAVFSHCSSAVGVIPSPVAGDEETLARADRAYQIAAALFYAGRYEQAREAFGVIAADPASPWRDLAPYLIARTLIREATVDAEDPRLFFESAAEVLRSILATEDLSRWHPAAERLLHFTQAKLDPRSRFGEVAAAVASPELESDLRQDLIDYLRLLPFAPLEEEDRDDLTDWLLTFAAKDEESVDHAVARWRETGDLPWLLAALSRVPAGHPEVPDLLAAADGLGEDHPLTLSLIFQRVRLEVAQGKTDEARLRLDALLASPEGLGLSDRNRLLTLRGELALGLEDLLVRAGQRPVLLETFRRDRDAAGQIPSVLAPFFSRIANYGLPLPLLTEAAVSETLRPDLRSELARSAWVRAVLLGEESAAASLASLVALLNPLLADQLAAYRQAPTPEERRFVAALTMLRYPGLRPHVPTSGAPRQAALAEFDGLRENWWCPLDRHHGSWMYAHWNSLNHQREGPSAITEGEPHSPEPPAFLGEAEKLVLADELRRLAELPTAPNYLSRVVIGWAGTHPEDPRVPEALHRAVKSTRYGCTDPDSSGLSKTAFQILHRRYAKSPWAAKTPFWY